MDAHLIPAREVRAEIRVVNSRFIATAAPAFTTAEAKAFIGRVKHLYADATHNVSAYIVGHGNSLVAHCHDDGEPSGTAGRPALAVLQGSGLGDIAVVVTRYYGGTKLGTGGLVRAYGDAVRGVLEALPRAAKVAVNTVAVEMPYPYFERIRRLAEAFQGQILDQDFGVDVTLRVRLPVDQQSAFEEALRELSGGALSAEVIEANRTAIVPVEETV
jgi:uncharacterized YigZ family protein